MQLSVVSASGTVAFGQFFSGFQDIQIKRAVPFWQRWRIKEWQHFLIVTPELLMSFAVIDAKYLELAWCQFVDRRSGQRLEHNRRGLCARAHLGPNLLDTHSRWHSPGFSIDIHNHLAAAARGARAGVASRTNTLFSIPMLFFMGAASHMPIAVSDNRTLYWVLFGVIALALEVNALKGKTGPLTTVKGVVASGFGLTALLYVLMEVIL